MNTSQSMFNLSTNSPQYVPSHLSKYSSRNTSQQHLQQSSQSRPSPQLRRSSTFSKFGGPSFGTPRPSRASRSQESSLEDAPPTESIYDFDGGSSFVASPSTPANTSSLTKSTTPATLASVPSSVIIFGFPTHLTSQVLTHFSRYGQIEDHSADAHNLSVGNNWIKITYKDAASARQAVSANGTPIGGAYMVGCVFAQDDPLTSIDNQGDAMEIDPMTPPRQSQTSSYKPNHDLMTPSRPKSAPNASTPGGRKIEILSTDAIYKSSSPITERAASWMPSWLSGTAEEPKVNAPEPAQKQNDASWSSKVIQGLMDTIFGF